MPIGTKIHEWRDRRQQSRPVYASLSANNATFIRILGIYLQAGESQAHLFEATTIAPSNDKPGRGSDFAPLEAPLEGTK